MYCSQILDHGFTNYPDQYFTESDYITSLVVDNFSHLTNVEKTMSNRPFQ